MQLEQQPTPQESARVSEDSDEGEEEKDDGYPDIEYVQFVAQATREIVRMRLLGQHMDSLGVKVKQAGGLVRDDTNDDDEMAGMRLYMCFVCVCVCLFIRSCHYHVCYIASTDIKSGQSATEKVYPQSIYEGWLRKQGGKSFMVKYQKRYCVLFADKFLYFASIQDARDMNWKGEVHLKGGSLCFKVELGMQGYNPKLHEFMLDPIGLRGAKHTRMYRFRSANSDDNEVHYVSIMIMYCERLCNGMFMSVCFPCAQEWVRLCTNVTKNLVTSVKLSKKRSTGGRRTADPRASMMPISQAVEFLAHNRENEVSRCVYVHAHDYMCVCVCVHAHDFMHIFLLLLVHSCTSNTTTRCSLSPCWKAT